MAPLQKRALYGLILVLFFSAAMFILFFSGGGIDKFEADAGFRLAVDALCIAGLVTPLVLFRPIMQNQSKFDERDKLIMNKATFIQWATVIVSLAAWVIILTEAYHTGGKVPVNYLYILFLSILLISTLAQSLGILIGYWRMNSHG
jgi:hypothetical protein